MVKRMDRHSTSLIMNLLIAIASALILGALIFTFMTRSFFEIDVSIAFMLSLVLALEIIDMLIRHLPMRLGFKS
jgi:hypothetical protein